jgi:NADH:ubiquinone oxidoreductase subunit H
MILLSMAFFTLLERKVLGYIQLRKGPNKVSIIGLPQPLADAVKLFFKEQKKINKINTISFYVAPTIRLTLALLLWTIIPYMSTIFILIYSTLGFLCISRLRVYIIISAG